MKQLQERIQTEEKRSLRTDNFNSLDDFGGGDEEDDDEVLIDNNSGRRPPAAKPGALVLFVRDLDCIIQWLDNSYMALTCF